MHDDNSLEIFAQKMPNFATIKTNYRLWVNKFVANQINLSFSTLSKKKPGEKIKEIMNLQKNYKFSNEIFTKVFRTEC